MMVLREVYRLRLGQGDWAGPQQPEKGLDLTIPALPPLCSPQSPSLAPTPLPLPLPQPEQGLENR